MKQLLFTAGLMACATISFAQTRAEGRVFDSKSGQPLAGANIIVNGKKTVTDANGHFTYDCTASNTFRVSFVGYDSRQVTHTNCSEPAAIALTPIAAVLNEVEITATSAQNRNLLNQPSSISKLNPQQLQRSTGLFLDDAINANVPGVVMQRRAVSSGQQLNIRGYGGGTRGTAGVSSNFDIQGVKVYLNGIPLTDAEGITILDDVDFGSIGNVEIVKGPAGSLYGLAIAGVANLHTLRPEAGKRSAGQQVLMGSNGLERYTTSLQLGAQRSSILLNYGHQESKGYMPHNASHKDFVNFAGDFSVSEKQSLSVYAGFANSYDQRAGELTIGQYDTLNWSGNPEYIKRDAHSHVQSFRVGATHSYQFGRHLSNSTTLFGSGVLNDASSAAGWTDKIPVNWGLRSVFNTSFAIGANSVLSGVAGVEAQQQRSSSILYNMVPDSNTTDPANHYRIGLERSNQMMRSGTASVFTEWTLAFARTLSVTAGLSWSGMKIRLEDRYNRSSYRVPEVFTRNYDDMWSPRLAVNKVFSKSISVFASLSRGYRAPTSSYFYIPYVAGAPATGRINEGLKPESGTQLEAGTKGFVLGNRVQFEATYFHSEFRDKMTSVAIPLDTNQATRTTQFSYVVNGGSQVQNGVEAALRWYAVTEPKGFLTQVAPFVNLTWIDAHYRNFRYQRFRVSPNQAKDSTVDYSGKRVAGLPPLVFNIGVDITTKPGLYANAFYSYRDAVYLGSDNVETQKAKSFGLLNAKIGFRHAVGQHFDVDVFAGGSNLTGAKYYYMVFANQLPDAYLPAPLNAQWFGSVAVRYNF
ncbi:TonB-dependent receptor [Flaviaesturariibacter terrae]